MEFGTRLSRVTCKINMDAHLRFKMLSFANTDHRSPNRDYSVWDDSVKKYRDARTQFLCIPITRMGVDEAGTIVEL
jgi:hypothetical protein